MKTQLSAILTMLVAASAAPVIYDQRQDGKLNVHAKLENFLIVIATSGKNNDFGSLGSLALQTMLEARKNIHRQPAKADEYKLEESNASEEGKEPYSVEILRLRKEDEGQASESSVEVSKQGVTAVVIQENSAVDTSGSSHTKSSKDVVAQPVDASSSSSSQQEHHIQKKVAGSDHHSETSEVDIPKVEQKNSGVIQKSDQGEKDDGNVVPSAVKSAEKVERAKTAPEVDSVDRQVADEAKQEPDSSKEKVHEVEHNPAHQMKLLGDGLENCGPGRFRNRLGICQFEGTVN